jgi:hypothetical protein
MAGPGARAAVTAALSAPGTQPQARTGSQRPPTRRKPRLGRQSSAAAHCPSTAVAVESSSAHPVGQPRGSGKRRSRHTLPAKSQALGTSRTPSDSELTDTAGRWPESGLPPTLPAQQTLQLRCKFNHDPGCNPGHALLEDSRDADGPGWRPLPAPLRLSGER